MFATSRKTRTASAVTSGPTPSPGRTTIFSLISPLENFLSSKVESVAYAAQECQKPARQQAQRGPPSRSGFILYRYRPRPLSRLGRNHRFRLRCRFDGNQRNKILIVDSLLAISQLREPSIGRCQLVFAERVTK